MTCQYETLDGETHPQASKRKYDEMARSYSTYTELFHMLGNRSERDAAKIFHRIRCGENLEEILKLMQTDDATLLMQDSRRLAHERFLVALAHSTGSLRDIISLAASTLDPTAKVRLPHPRDFLVLRNRIVHLPNVKTLLHRSEQVCNELPVPLLADASNPSVRNALPGLDASNYCAGGNDPTSENHPPHEVPAAPWTTITASDEAVSHLVSLFLAWINPTWRFVEQDLFLHGECTMRSFWASFSLALRFKR